MPLRENFLLFDRILTAVLLDVVRTGVGVGGIRGVGIIGSD